MVVPPVAVRDLKCQTSEFAAQSLEEQQRVEGDNHGGGEVSKPIGAMGVAQMSHDIGAARKNNQRDQGEGQGKAQHHLGEHQNLQRVKTDGNHHDCRNHGDQAAKENGKLDFQEALDDDLSGHGAHRRRREAGQQEGYAEGHGGKTAQQRAQGLMRLFDRHDVAAGMSEYGGSHDDHGGVDQPGAVHGGQHIPQFIAHVAHAVHGSVWRPLFLLLDTVLHQRRVQVHHVGHNRGAQHAHGNINAGGSQVGNDNVMRHAVPLRMSEKDFHRVAGSNAENKSHDHLLQAAETVQFGGQNEKHADASEQGGEQQVDIQQQIETEGSTEEFGQIGSEGSQFGGGP